MQQDLHRFIQQVGPQLAPGAVNLALVTDTHDLTHWRQSLYGPSGYWHVLEQHWLVEQLPITYRVHLGDLVDGSEPGFLTQWRLKNIVADFAASAEPFIITRGNHDDNDKFAEKNRRFVGSFPVQVFDRLVFSPERAQDGISVSEHGLVVADTDFVRVIAVNTSDVPARWINGRKNYDVKKTLAVTAGQLRELAQALATAESRDILIVSHAPAMNRRGKPALKYNGQALHNLLRAFTHRLKGTVMLGDNPDFGGEVPFDFSATAGDLIAVLAGHYHVEADYLVNGIHYSLQNVSALMGRRHALTTKYNRTWNRQLNTPTEYAGYVVSVDPPSRSLQIFGYGAASPERRFIY
ncbi:hypothetical protein FC34_GL001013 [Lacticaseibacillus brantae DSM 23927]|uniref:Calcineurin-like phosphoesterase domain-containing protein n=1 Tax=Lacticaseibacillus brantae DSM 23927 TaxID=1423727 RepID=A0A0R2AX88_9LACO|nr:hypothetical protein FC34_GL001013 [Lacticaseibacillus brantae DSM 23927]